MDSEPAIRRSVERREGLAPNRDHPMRGLSFMLPEPLPVTVPVSATNGHLPRDSPRRPAAAAAAVAPAAAAAAPEETAVAHSRPVRAASAGVAANMALLASLEAAEPQAVQPLPSALAAAAAPAAKRVHRSASGARPRRRQPCLDYVTVLGFYT